MSKKPPVVHAAGGLVWRASGRKLEVLLVHRPKYDDWSWPKGKLEAGETLPACAVREIAEETGIETVLGVPLPQVRYKLADDRIKVNHYWAAREIAPESPALAARVTVKPAAPSEVDLTQWMSAKKARDLLTSESDRAPLDALVDLWDEGALDTRVLVILRHGRAKKRSAWPKGGEEDRPLTATGVQQAVDDVATLSAFGVEQVLSSPWERCMATVRPYAAIADVEIGEVPDVTEDAAKRRPGTTRRAVSRLFGRFRAKADQVPVYGLVLCTHRPVMPVVLQAIADHAPNRVRVLLPDSNPYLKVGEALVAHVLPRHRRGPRVIAVEQYRPR